MAEPTSQLDLEQLARLLEMLSQATGTGRLTQFPGMSRSGPLGRGQGSLYSGGGQAPMGEWKPSVGGPGQPLGPYFAPQGVMFGGGSPFPVDAGPANLQNALVGLRDLMNTPLGQQAIAKLKAKLGGQP